MTTVRAEAGEHDAVEPVEGVAVGGLLDRVDRQYGTRRPGIGVPLARDREIDDRDLVGDPADDLADDLAGDPVEDLVEDDEDGRDDQEEVDGRDGADVGVLLLLAARSRELDPAWKDRALCAETDPEAFFPEKGGSTREAKRVCSVCEVRAECLDFALSNDERFGIWGGLSERERRRLKKRVG